MKIHGVFSRISFLIVAVVIAAACGSSSQGVDTTTTTSADSTPTTPSSTTAPTTTAPTTTTLPAGASLDQRVVVDAEGREAAVRCWGEGSPTFMIDTGSDDSGIGDFTGAPFTDELAAMGTVCTYDRLGEGASDDPPNRLRTADDVVEVLHAVIEESGIETPLILIGASFGGMIVTHHAAVHPEDAAAVVLLDVPAPVANLPYPELDWDHPTNVERLDIVNGFEGRFAESKSPIEAPLLVITADGGETDVEDQSAWLEISDDALQVELPGSHDIAISSPEEVVAEIEGFLAGR